MGTQLDLEDVASTSDLAKAELVQLRADLAQREHDHAQAEVALEALQLALSACIKQNKQYADERDELRAECRRIGKLLDESHETCKALGKTAVSAHSRLKDVRVELEQAHSRMDSLKMTLEEERDIAYQDIRALITVLEWYSNKDNYKTLYPSIADNDKGERARAVIKATVKETE